MCTNQQGKAYTGPEFVTQSQKKAVHINMEPGVHNENKYRREKYDYYYILLK